MCRRKLFVLVLLSLLVLGLVPMAQAQLKTPGVATIYINEILVSNAGYNIDDDTTQFSDWIELFNAGNSAINLNGYYLTDDLTAPQKFEINDNIWLAAGDTVLFWADDEDGGVHTNFKLKGSGESVGLYDSNVQLVDAVIYSAQLPDISYGRQPDGAASWVYFGEPTPESINDTPGFVDQNRAPSPQFSLVGGFYDGVQTVEILPPAPTATMYFTLDGSVPTQSSTVYANAIQVDETAVLRARAFDSTMLPSVTATQSYFIDEAVTLPVVSVATNPDNLWDNTIGIYVVGTNGTLGNCSSEPENWHQDWERPSNVALYNLDGSVDFQLDAGIEIHGACSRDFSRKSLAVRARDKYGVDRVDAQLYEEKPIDSFKSFILRNSGNDAEMTIFRDAMMQQLINGQMDVDYQAYRPVVVFLNGEYWGIHNIREKIDEDFVEANHGVDANQIDLLERNSWIVEGDDQHYSELIDYMGSHHLSNPDYYDYVSSQMDVDEFMNYQIVETYVANLDWPANNLKFWRPQTPTGAWRWFLFDLDWGFGYVSPTQYNVNMINFATQTDGPAWPNPPWGTVVLRNLLENQSFEDEFMQRFASHINITFAPQRVTEKINTIQAGIAPEMPAHIARWGKPMSMSAWDDNVDVLRDFGDERPAYMLEDINNHFGHPGMTDLTVNIVGEGDVFVSSVKVPAGGYSGSYYRDVPMQLRAVPALGYEFVEWQETAVTDAQTALTINTATTITAVFEAVPLPNLVINELHYHPSFDLQGTDELYEFLEIYNAGDTAVDLDNFSISDGVLFTFPVGTSIAPDEYIVVSINSATYSGNGYQLFQWTSGKLNNTGERVALSNDLGQVLDEVTYDDESPWDTTPDGIGPSLSLINPAWDNSLAINWIASDVVGGTPGMANSVACTTTTTTALSIASAAPNGELSWTDSDPDGSRGYEIWHSDTAVYFQPEDVNTTNLPAVDTSPYLHIDALTDTANHYYRVRSINRCMQPTAPSNLVGIFKYDLVVAE